MKSIPLLLLLATLFVLAACSQAGDQPATTAVVDEAAPPAEDTPTPQPAVTEAAADTQPEADAQPTVDPEDAPVEPTNPAIPPTATTPQEPTEATLIPIEVTYFTPGQGEGPYYPLEKLDDRDNDLTVLDGSAGAPTGEIIEFTGTVYDVTGLPVPGVVVEIWQTDESGVYLHPGDPGTGQRDKNFQFYGEDVTAADGSYGFRTILPGHYEPRPRHIHVKVKYEGNELLTTQFYFEGDPELADEAMFNQVEGDGVHLIISLSEGQDANGHSILIGQRDIILNADL